MALSLDDLTFLGRGLKRPECVLCTSDGSVFAADWEGGVTRIAPHGAQMRILAKNDDWVRPNGIALRRDGSFLLAHLGDESGGVFRLDRDGALRPVLTEVEGVPLPPSNFVLEDAQGRLWITVSTRLRPRILGCRADAADGFIVLLDDRGARIVADGLGYANEVQFDAEGRYLYVNETFGRRLARFRVAPDGALSDYEVVAEFGAGTFPDGLAFDTEGAIWVVSIVSNRVIRVRPGGRQEVMLEDSDPAHLDRVETAYAAGVLARRHLDRIESRRLRNISSLAFGGPDLRTVYLGCLLGDSLACFRAPVAGRPPLHWEVAA